MTAHTEDNFLEASLLERYCSGTASAEENAQIDDWFGGHPGRRVWYEQLRAGLREVDLSISVEEQRAAWLETIRSALKRRSENKAELLAAIPEKIGPASLAQRTFPEYSGVRTFSGPQTFRNARQKEGVFSGRTLRHWIWSVVATLVVAVTVAVAGWNAGVGYLTRRESVAVSTYTTGNGQRANITLPDGSTVALNVASRLDVPADYSTGDRRVHLMGEGLFTVQPHEKSPFLVIAGATTTRVLGTRFVVRHYASDRTTLVAVQDGKVSVRSVVLTAGRQIDIPRTGTPTLQDADPGQFSFAAGILTLNGARLSDAIPQLDRWYDTEIRLGDPRLAEQRMTAGLPSGTLSDLAELLTLTFNVRVLRDGRTLTLVPR